MSETYAAPTIAGYREAVRAQLAAGDAFDEVESAIDEIAVLSEDQRAALWLFAFSRRHPGTHRQAQLTIAS